MTRLDRRWPLWLAIALIACASAVGASSHRVECEDVVVKLLAPRPGDWVAMTLDVAWSLHVRRGDVRTIVPGSVPPVSFRVSVNQASALLDAPTESLIGQQQESALLRNVSDLTLTRSLVLGKLEGWHDLDVVCMCREHPLWQQTVRMGFIAVQTVPPKVLQLQPRAAWYHAHTDGAHTVSATRSPVSKLRPPLSFQGHPGFVGARTDWHDDSSPDEVPHVLVAGAVGGPMKPSVKTMLDRLCQTPPTDRRKAIPSVSRVQCTVMLFVYDGSDWHDVASLLPSTTVIQRPGQMKWWYVKRFLPPSLIPMSVYDFVVILDEDAVLPPSFDAVNFFRLVKQHNLHLAQPAHATEASGTRLEPFLVADHPGFDVRLRSDGAVGYRTNFVECGPFVVVSSQAWPCIWELLQADLVTGYGYDLVWSSVCAAHSTGVIHSHPLLHANAKSASTRPNFFSKSVGEAIVLFDRVTSSVGAQAIASPKVLAPLLPPRSDHASATIGVDASATQPSIHA